MSKCKYNEKEICLRSIRDEDAGVKKLQHLCKKLRKRNCHDLISAVDCENETSASSNSSRHYKQLGEKLKKQEQVNVKRQKKKTVSVGRTTVPITPQMIRVAVKELQTRRAYISSSLIAKHLRRIYPIENNPDSLKGELNEKLNCAVCVGLIAKCGDDKYCIPTLRQQANFNKTAVTAFWDTYYGSSAPSTMGQFITLGMLKAKADRTKANVTLNYSSDCSSNSL